MQCRLRNKHPWKNGTTIVIDSDDSSEDNNKSYNKDSLMVCESNSDNGEDSGIHHSGELFGSVMSPNNDISNTFTECSSKCSEKDISSNGDKSFITEVRITKLRTFKTYGDVKWKRRKVSNEWEAAKQSMKLDAPISNKKWSVKDKLKNVDVDVDVDVDDVNITPIKYDVINDIGSPAKHSTPLQDTEMLLTTPVCAIKVSAHLRDGVGFHRSISSVQSPLKNNSNIKTLLSSNKTAALSSLSTVLKPDQSFHSERKDEVEVSYIITIEGRILNLCEQESIMNINHYVNHRNCSFVRKIAEGSYGEVFEKKIENNDSLVVKIVPVGCPEVLVNGIPQMTLEEVISEMAISKSLSGLNEINNGDTTYKMGGFLQLHRLLFCEGRYPHKLIKLWECWDGENESENDNPKKLMRDQMYIIFETDYCGTDLEHFKVKNQAEAFSILKQVIASLAVAEKMYQFEHRDLHWGNILIMHTNKQTIDFVIGDKQYSFDSCRVLVSIIDFTLSRIQSDECVVYTDLGSEKDLFKGQGDIQFNVYRDMKEHNGNDWESFNPYSNVLWVHYVAKKLIKKAKNNVRLKGFLRQVLTYKSACEILECNEFID